MQITIQCDVINGDDGQEIRKPLTMWMDGTDVVFRLGCTTADIGAEELLTALQALMRTTDFSRSLRDDDGKPGLP